MRSYDLYEMMQNAVEKVDALFEKQDIKQAIKVVEETDEQMKPYLDTCKFTCSDFIDREKFNLQARKDAIDGYLNATTSQDKLHYLKMYNLSQNELCSLWNAWKPSIQGFKLQMKHYKQKVEQLKLQQELSKKN